jgi:hypothetical protein
MIYIQSSLHESHQTLHDVYIMYMHELDMVMMPYSSPYEDDEIDRAWDPYNPMMPLLIPI